MSSRRQSADQIPSSLEDLSLFFPPRSSTDWMGPTHIMKGNLLYLKATDLNVIHIFRTPSQQHLGWYLNQKLVPESSQVDT